MRGTGKVPPGTIHDVIASRVRQARLAANLSQQRLADMLGIDQGHLSRIESRKARATVELLAEIAELTGVSLNFLCGRRDALDSTAEGAAETRELLEMWGRIPPQDRATVLRLMDALARAGNGDMETSDD